LAWTTLIWASVAILFNTPFLWSLWRWRGALFLLQSCGFLLADLYVSGIGIALGLVDFALGRRY